MPRDLRRTDMQMLEFPDSAQAGKFAHVPGKGYKRPSFLRRLLKTIRAWISLRTL